VPRRLSNQRRIYIKNFGGVPKDEYGRSFDIHHKDGDHRNNDPSNLIAISIEEHYNIHYLNEDWNAARLIAIRMSKSPDEISELSRKSAKEKIKNGTHHFIELNKRDRSDMRGDLNPMKNLEIAKRSGESRQGKSKSDETKEKCRLGTKNRPKITCEHCGAVISFITYSRWHGNACLSNINNKDRTRVTNFTINNPSKITITCEHCDKTICKANYVRWHGDNCKEKR
jgi:hypothetical protein